MGPAYSLSTEGQLIVLGQQTRMSHQLSISDTRASSFFKLDPLEGKPFMVSSCLFQFESALPSLLLFYPNFTFSLKFLPQTF